MGGQGSAGTGSWQAPGPHHLILLHVGQGVAGGYHCGRHQAGLGAGPCPSLALAEVPQAAPRQSPQGWGLTWTSGPTKDERVLWGAGLPPST